MISKTQGFPVPFMWQQNITQCITLPSSHGAIFTPGSETPSSGHTYDRKWDKSNEAIFFHSSMTKFWHSHSHCKHFWRWTCLSMGILTQLQLWKPHMQQPVMHFVFWDLYHSQHFSVFLLWDWSRWASFCSPHASLSLDRLWPSPWFIRCPYLEHMHVRPAALEILWPTYVFNPYYIQYTVVSVAQIFTVADFSCFNTLTLRAVCLLVT